MRQLLLSLLFILQGLTAEAQDYEATMYFHDGTDVTGYASIKFIKESFYGIAKDKISFRVSQDEEAELWDEESHCVASKRRKASWDRAGDTLRSRGSQQRKVEL